MYYYLLLECFKAFRLAEEAGEPLPEKIDRAILTAPKKFKLYGTEGYSEAKFGAEKYGGPDKIPIKVDAGDVDLDLLSDITRGFDENIIHNMNIMKKGCKAGHLKFIRYDPFSHIFYRISDKTDITSQYPIWLFPKLDDRFFDRRFGGYFWNWQYQPNRPTNLTSWVVVKPLKVLDLTSVDNIKILFCDKSSRPESTRIQNIRAVISLAFSILNSLVREDPVAIFARGDREVDNV